MVAFAETYRVESRNADHSLKARFTHGYTNIEGIGSCIEVYRASDSKRFYLLYDHRGSAWVLLDENKAEVGRRLYNAFGELVQETLATGYSEWPDEVPFGYQSNWLRMTTLPDGSPVYLSPTRLYQAGTGRFLQRDQYSFGPDDMRIILSRAEGLLELVEQGEVDLDGLVRDTGVSLDFEGIRFSNQRLRRMLRRLSPRDLREALKSRNFSTQRRAVRARGP